MRYKVINTNILVEIVESSVKNIVTTEDDKIVKGHVLEIGTGTYYDGQPVPMQVRPDSFIWFNKAFATKLPFADNLYILTQDEILVVEED